MSKFEKNKEVKDSDFGDHTVDDSYFDDAVFIGDSRTVGMYECEIGRAHV